MIISESFTQTLNLVASILGIISFFSGLFVAITKFRTWLLQYPNTKWFVKIPWSLILIIVGIFLGINVGVKYKNAYYGVSVASTVTACGMGIKLLQDSLLLSRFRETYNKLRISYNNLTKAINRVQDIDLTLSDWIISHTILENGTGILKEELTIVPFADPVVYYYKRINLAPNSDPEKIKFHVVNTSDNTPLEFYEVSVTEDSVKYMIILEPPSTLNTPKRISIICEREKIWEDLLKKGQDTGYFNANYKADNLRMELIAPPIKKWKAFHAAPSTGKVNIEMLGGVSRVTWEIQNPSIKKYNYRVFLDGETSS